MVSRYRVHMKTDMGMQFMKAFELLSQADEWIKDCKEVDSTLEYCILETMAKSKPRKLPKELRYLIEETISAAKLERCGCSEAAKKEMKCYLDTWVVGRLEQLLDWDEGKKSARDCYY